MTESGRQRLAVCLVLLTLGVCIKRLGVDARYSVPATKNPTIHRDNEPLVVELCGQNLRWTIRYPGIDRKLHTEDDLQTTGRLHLPSDCRVTILLRSADFLYSFGVPALRLQQIAVPDLVFDLHLVPMKSCELKYFGDQFCGGNHDLLSGQIVVESANEFNQWLERLKTRP